MRKSIHLVAAHVKSVSLLDGGMPLLGRLLEILLNLRLVRLPLGDAVAGPDFFILYKCHGKTEREYLYTLTSLLCALPSMLLVGVGSPPYSWGPGALRFRLHLRELIYRHAAPRICIGFVA